MCWPWRHKWKEVKRKHSPSKISKFNVTEGSVRELMYGVTVIEYECERCPCVKFEHVAGDIS